jgi:AraC-like DNA-binding protein
VEAVVPPDAIAIRRVIVSGVFAVHGGPGAEPSGALGASLHLRRHGEDVQRISLVQGRHYGEPDPELQIFRPNGDGTSIESVSTVEVEGKTMRVDSLAWDVAPGPDPESILFRDLGTPASFIVFDILLETEELDGGEEGPPGGAMARSLRLRDRRGFTSALRRAELAMAAAQGDERTALGALFVAMAASAVEEVEPGRLRSRFMLEAWEMIADAGSEGAAEAAGRCIQLAVKGFFPTRDNPTEGIIERAIAYVERHSSEPLTDEVIADRFGLSTSHFRHLFKQVTRQPFHRYLLNVRLERAREELLVGEQKVSVVSSRLGFASPAHFSRVFVQKFGVTPSQLRSGRRLD